MKERVLAVMVSLILALGAGAALTPEDADGDESASMWSCNGIRLRPFIGFCIGP